MCIPYLLINSLDFEEAFMKAMRPLIICQKKQQHIKYKWMLLVQFVLNLRKFLN